jgi:hypothetical protein
MDKAPTKELVLVGSIGQGTLEVRKKQVGGGFSPLVVLSMAIPRVVMQLRWWPYAESTNWVSGRGSSRFFAPISNRGHLSQLEGVRSGEPVSLTTMGFKASVFNDGDNTMRLVPHPSMGLKDTLATVGLEIVLVDIIIEYH